jgi:pantoate--beta-alanine ligase
MITFQEAAALTKYLEAQRDNNQRISFIPTMGALHEGHLALVKDAMKAGGITVCSIFVNPAQFNNPIDFEKYPLSIEDDISKLEQSGTSVVFNPSVDEVYPAGYNGLRRFDLGYLETVLEGSSRPGHFQGVCQVMQRLLAIVQPHLLFMGQKDYQQCLVVKRLIMLMGLPVKLITAPTVREQNGLAMSSRNRRLSPEGRSNAAAIYESLCYVKEHIVPGPVSGVLKAASGRMVSRGIKVDYIEIADADNLKIIQDWDGERSIVCVAAAFLEDVRLIDNIILHSSVSTEVP